MCIDFYVRVMWEKTTWWPQPSHISSWILGLDNASCVVFVSLFQIMHGQLNYLWVSLLESIHLCYSFRLCLVGPLLNCVRLSGECLLLSTHWQTLKRGFHVLTLQHFDELSVLTCVFLLFFCELLSVTPGSYLWTGAQMYTTTERSNSKKHDTSYTGLLRSILRLIIADRVTFQREDIVPDSVCQKII